MRREGWLETHDPPARVTVLTRARLSFGCGARCSYAARRKCREEGAMKRVVAGSLRMSCQADAGGGKCGAGGCGGE